MRSRTICRRSRRSRARAYAGDAGLQFFGLSEPYVGSGRSGASGLCGGAALHRGTSLAGGDRCLRDRAARALSRTRTVADQEPDAIGRVLDDRRCRSALGLSRRARRRGRGAQYQQRPADALGVPVRPTRHRRGRAGSTSCLWHRLLHGDHGRTCRAGTIAAVEIDAALAEKARVALAPWPQVAVRNADGATIALDPADVVVASAGATHPLASWLDALKPGGRLLFPMTSNEGPGGMLLVTRQGSAAAAYAARFLSCAAFIDFSGARDPEVSPRLAAALTRDRGGAAVRSLRRAAHTEEESCWLHGEGWCLSRLDPAEPHGAP